MSESETGREFDDVQVSGPFASSEKARGEMRRLAHEYGLSFTHNPGGGEFYGAGTRCQITTNNDIDDLATLREAVARLAARTGRNPW